MIRAFLTTWSLRISAEGMRVVNPVLDYLDANTLSASVRASYHYADADQDGKPDHPFLVVVVDSDAPEMEDVLGALDGVMLSPPHALNKRTQDVPQPDKDRANGALAAAGFVSRVDNFPDVQSVVYAVMREINPKFQGFGTRYEARAEDWG